MKAPVNAGTRQRKAPLRGSGCANAHTDTAAPGDRWVGRVDVRRGRVGWFVECAATQNGSRQQLHYTLPEPPLLGGVEHRSLRCRHSSRLPSLPTFSAHSLNAA